MNGVATSLPLRTMFIRTVESFCGTRVVHRGRLPGVGLDCVGVPIMACRYIGLEVPEPRVYGKLPDGDTLRAGLLDYCREMPVETMVPGDLLQVYAGKQARHIVVYTAMNECGQPVVVHAWGKNSIVQRALLEGIKVAACWVINGMT